MPVIEVSNLKKAFKDDLVVKGLDFNLEQGKCIALLGPNGAGKTTTLRMLSGLLKPTEGSIQSKGQRREKTLEIILVTYHNTLSSILGCPEKNF